MVSVNNRALLSITRSEERMLTVFLPENMVNNYLTRPLSDRLMPPSENGQRVEREKLSLPAIEQQPSKRVD
jgi:hypothetical protein